MAMIKIIIKEGLHFDEWKNSDPGEIPRAAGIIAGHVSLFNYGRWPKTLLSKTIYECNQLSQVGERGAFLILWVPYRMIHSGAFHAGKIMGIDAHNVWLPTGSILTHSEMGFVYRKPHPSEFGVTPVNMGCKKFFQERHAQKSSAVAKFIVEKLCEKESVIVDSGTDKTAHLAIWAKRKGAHYLGYAKDSGDYEEINKKLAQVELPLIQGGLFDDRPTNQSQ